MNKIITFFLNAIKPHSGISSKRLSLFYLFILYGFVIIYSVLKNIKIDDKIYYSLEILIISCLGGMAFDRYKDFKGSIGPSKKIFKTTIDNHKISDNNGKSKNNTDRK